MKKIALLSSNKNKLQSYEKHFSLYGIKVVLMDYIEKEKLIESEDYLAVLWDISDLYNRETKAISKKEIDMELVFNQTTLYYIINKNEKEIKSKEINGYMDLSKKEDPNSKWWDDIFILSKMGMSYKELSKKGMKNSGREEVISRFILEELYYKNKVDLNFNPQKNTRTIQFDGNSIDFVNENKYLNTPSNKVFNNIFNLSLNNGAFFRSAKNRREKNYWIPGLNAGIPLVPKRDNVHEITFAVHDLCHFIMPDLIYTGREIEDNKNIYIIHRMMSEAITMVLADMVFIDGLKKDGIDYDFSKRKIYPLYEKIKDNNLKDILYANVKYCLTGSDEEYKKLLNYENLEVLENFKDKYMPFFVEDYKWTIKNFENMQSNKKTFYKWSNDLKDILRKNKLMRISDLTRSIGFKGDIIDNVFEYVVENIYFNAMKESPKQSKERNISNSFKKYMIGQMHIFYKFDFVQVSNLYKDKIKSYLSKDLLNKEEIENIRALYEEYLKNLVDLNLINLDDFHTYKETYPIFDSFFVFYDKNKKYYTSLEETYNKTLGERKW